MRLDSFVAGNNERLSQINRESRGGRGERKMQQLVCNRTPSLYFTPMHPHGHNGDRLNVKLHTFTNARPENTHTQLLSENSAGGANNAINERRKNILHPHTHREEYFILYISDWASGVCKLAPAGINSDKSSSWRTRIKM